MRGATQLDVGAPPASWSAITNFGLSGSEASARGTAASLARPVVTRPSLPKTCWTWRHTVFTVMPAACGNLL